MIPGAVSQDRRKKRIMKHTEAIIIGGGQAGLAMSRSLLDGGCDHVVLERGRVGERWRTERWDSLRLLTPNWQSRLPGWSYQGATPNEYMSMPELIHYLEDYARSFSAPVEVDTTVISVTRRGDDYLVRTDKGDFQAPNVVIATGHCDKPFVPSMAMGLAPNITQVTPTSYKNPAQLSMAPVLVVGASATGAQLAAEIQESGRPVTLAVGRHTRLPRCYRGKDILWWLDAMGLLSQHSESVHDLGISRRQPSLQLIGRPGETLDLRALASRGIRLLGRVKQMSQYRVELSDDLLATVVAADVKLWELQKRIDAFIRDRGMQALAGPPEEFVPLTPTIGTNVPTAVDLMAEGVRTVVWATGFRRSYPWLHVPVLDQRGEIRHHAGVTESDGLYVIGLRFLRRRNSSFIDGVGADAIELGDLIAQSMGARGHAVA